MNYRQIITAAKVVSGLFNPFIIPFIAFLLLFMFTYLKIMPFQYKMIILVIVYCFTILMPLVSIYLFRKINSKSENYSRSMKSQLIPYLLTLIAYSFCLGLMLRLRLPSYMTGIILASVISILFCLVLSLQWRVSIHMVGIGGSMGCLVAFSSLFYYNPIIWLCIFILIAGIVGSSRMIVARNTLPQVLTSFLIGFCSMIYGIVLY